MYPPVGRSQPANPPSYPMLPPRRNAPAQPPAPRTQNYKALPGPYNQGCLWGLLQGILATFIVLSMKNQANLYVAIVEGFFFYFLAGVFTTRKGGSSLRGIWAGFWSGIFSTIVFWVALLVGLLIQTVQLVQFDANIAKQQGQPFDLANDIGRAFHQVTSVLANQQNTQQGSGGAGGVITFLVAGLIIAMLCGWCGGLLGSMWARRRGLA